MSAKRMSIATHAALLQANTFRRRQRTNHSLELAILALTGAWVLGVLCGVLLVEFLG